MKKVLRSLTIVALALTLMVGASSAYFSSSVTAQDNVISTGTLMLAVDTAQNSSYVGTWGAPNAWEVVRQNLDGSVTQSNYFIPWTNVAPGETNEYFVSVRNAGTIDANIRATATGSWVSGPRFGQTLPGNDGVAGTGDDFACPATPAEADASLVSVSNVHLFAAAPGTGCENQLGCRNLRDALLTGPWTTLSGLTAGDKTAPEAGYYYGTTNGSTNYASNQANLFNLGANEFVIYRVSTALNGPATNDCYQGATYNFDFTVQGKQYNAPTF